MRLTFFALFLLSLLFAAAVAAPADDNQALAKKNLKQYNMKRGTPTRHDDDHFKPKPPKPSKYVLQFVVL